MSELVTTLAAQIADYIRLERLPVDTHLPERQLAEQFRVSRSPVREALRLLQDRGAVRHVRGTGYLTTGNGESQTGEDLLAEQVDGDLYLQLAEDHLTGSIPERVSQNALMRRYGTTPGQIKRVLMRASQEGWAERLPGHGWAFLPVLKSIESYEQSYRFRMLIEPAGMVEPGFRLNEAALLRVRAQQERLLTSDISALSASVLFQAGVRVHETIMECSGNLFFVDGLRRANQLRRLLAYQRITPSWVNNCQSHIQIIDLLLQGERAEAAARMKDHLEASLEGSRAIVKRISRAIQDGDIGKRTGTKRW